MKKISFICGSPKGKNSFSGKLLNILGDTWEGEKNFLSVSFNGKYEERAFEEVAASDAIVIAFPLYYYCLPGVLLNFIQQYCEYYLHHAKSNQAAKVYVVVNCGFPEASINLEAIEVIKSFCKKAGLNFRFAISIGGGGLLDGAGALPFFKKSMSNIRNALQHVKSDIYAEICKENPDTILLNPAIPKFLVFLLVNMNWHFQSKKRGLSKTDLMKQPYAE